MLPSWNLDSLSVSALACRLLRDDRLQAPCLRRTEETLRLAAGELPEEATPPLFRQFVGRLRFGVCASSIEAGSTGRAGYSSGSTILFLFELPGAGADGCSSSMNLYVSRTDIFESEVERYGDLG